MNHMQHDDNESPATVLHCSPPKSLIIKHQSTPCNMLHVKSHFIMTDLQRSQIQGTWQFKLDRKRGPIYKKNLTMNLGKTYDKVQLRKS